jgi:DUF1680 family protein
VLERVLYNGFLSGISLSGDKFFYPNPLASDGKYKFNINESATRRPWFDCSCCPTNVVRFLPSLAGYIYAHRDDSLYVNLFIEGSGTVKTGDNTVKIVQETDYPWGGRVKIKVEPERSEEFSICFRIPGWVRNQPMPSDLYRYVDKSGEKVELRVNGAAVRVNIEKGFARISRRWKKVDEIDLNLPMRIRRLVCDEKVEANLGRVALERGPIVYCAEGVDNGGQVFNIVLPDDVELKPEYRKNILGGVMVVTGKARGLHSSVDGKSVETREQEFVAIPYYAWSHRGVGEMLVWLPRRVMLDFDVL